MSTGITWSNHGKVGQLSKNQVEVAVVVMVEKTVIMALVMVIVAVAAAAVLGPETLTAVSATLMIYQ